MNKITLGIGLAVMTIAVLTACSNNEEKNDGKGEQSPEPYVINMLPETRSVKLTKEQKAFIQQNNDFSFKLYRAFCEAAPSQNDLLSPISITYILGMLNDGAQGVTAREISDALGFGDNAAVVINEYCRALIEQAPAADPSVTLQLANIVAADNGIRMEDSFVQDMHDYYDAEVVSLCFSDSSGSDYLNEWCKKNSGGMIPKIADEIDPTTVMALLNAVYFKATWTEKFDVVNTHNDTFYKENDETVSLPMMWRKAQALYGSNDVYSQLCLPFGSGSAWEMYILLPNKDKTVNDVIKSISNNTWWCSTDSYLVDIMIPRFSTVSDLELNEAISKIGVPSIFDPKKADLSGISKNGHLFVNKIKQKATIEVDEQGTKTTAVSVADLALTSTGKSTREIEFHCNRPFVYLIRESSSGAIFFIGTFRGE